ncbi:Protein STB2 [Wickerhamiella sorbophila]|uniref:Protein STB2 n=1 Tax=Wickerhamiella sorbophila TaxID=45607 RepID=A0A2T0FNF8_9ASCO|nr:Protein STB2 [Wickerhamiella sorbophila]PRT56510.1 Protein STB2 [Wickerhamiella sorbophila]
MNAYLFIDSNTADTLVSQPECAQGPKRVAVKGYEAYLVEQWVCAREVNGVVSSYTGNSSDIVVANTVFMPQIADNFGAGSRQIFDALGAMHLLPKETEHGLMLVTNLSSLPSSWTLIPMPAGTRYEDAMRLFVVNENLRRLQCMGRLAVALEKPSSTAETKFRSIFMIHLDVPIEFAAQEIVVMVQMALYYSGLLEGHYVDGLLCDITLAKARDWWTKFGQRLMDAPTINDPQYFSITVAALIGWLSSMRSRLSALNYKPPKDVFDANLFSTCIKQFQKTEKMPRTGILDEKTTRKLSELAANRLKNFQNDFYTQARKIPKSAGADSNLMAFVVKNAKGARSQYLWQGSGSQYEPVSDPGVGEEYYCHNTGMPLHSLRVEDKALAQNKLNLVNRLRSKSRGQDFRKRDESSDLSFMGNFSTTSLEPAPRLGPLSAPALVPALPSLSTSALGPHDTEKPVPKDEAPCPRRLAGNLSIGTRDDSALNKSSSRRRAMRPRANSVSVIENVLHPSKKPASSARLHLLFREARELQDQVYERLNTDSKRCEELDHELERRSSEVNIEFRQTETMKYQVHATNRKEYAVKVRMHELEALMSKLDYEYNIIGSKVREVEQAVAEFGAKVEHLEGQFNRVRETPTSFWRTLFGY